jgi:hypothetical protein
MQIDFELPGLVDEARLNREVMPVGYVLEQSNDGRFWVLTEDNRVNVGRCELEEPFVKITFHTLVSEGRDFLAAFGRRFPEHDPLTLFFGFVYRLPNGLFRLDGTPLRLKGAAMKEIGRHTTADKAYFVSFYRGDWTDQALKVISMRAVLPNFTLGVEKGPASLDLEKERK